MEEQNRSESITGLMVEAAGPDGMFAIFQEDEGAGYFFVYKLETREVLAQIRIYESGHNLSVHENDVQVLWSTQYGRCGVLVWERMRGIIDLVSGNELAVPVENRESPGITDPEWLKGFVLDQDYFIRARQRYWKQLLKEHEPDRRPLPEEETPIETNFIRHINGTDDMFAVFEDDGETGYLYVYNAAENNVMRHLHIYDGSKRLDVDPKDVQVIWSGEGNKCGVAIWGKMRGIIDLNNGREGRVWLESRETPGIGDAEWLRGFFYLRG